MSEIDANRSHLQKIDDWSWFPRANFEEWATMARWKQHEFATLLFERDPHVATPDFIERYRTPFTQRYHKMMDRLHRAEIDGQIRFSARPDVCIEWALAHKVDVPQVLMKPVEEFYTGLRSIERLKHDLAQAEAELASARERIQELEHCAQGGPTEEQLLHPLSKDTPTAIINRLLHMYYGSDPRRAGTSSRSVAEELNGESEHKVGTDCFLRLSAKQGAVWVDRALDYAGNRISRKPYEEKSRN